MSLCSEIWEGKGLVSQCLIQNGNLKTSGDGMEKEMGALGLSIYIIKCEVVAKMIDYFLAL